MVSGKATQAAAFVYIAAALVMMFFPEARTSLALYADCPFLNRFAYVIVHGNWFHFLVNSWCLFSIVRYYRITPAMFMTSVIIAASFPCPLFGQAGVTVGMSGLCYALLGRYCLSVQRKVYYHSWFLFFIGIGFFFPNVNGWIHAWCYGLGVAAAYLLTPINKMA